MTEFELYQALKPLYPQREYALLPQAANGTGLKANRHADAIAMGLWPSRGLHLTGFEIKSYRGDWIRELRNPEKAEEIASYCHYWYIVAGSDGIAKEDEIPETWGLMVWDGKSLARKKKAPFREPLKQLDTPFVAAILRKAQEVSAPEEALREARDSVVKQAKKDAEAMCQFNQEQLDKLEKTIAEVKEASGIDLRYGWHHPKEVGLAIKAALGGSLMQDQARLRDLAYRIIEELGEKPKLPEITRKRR